MGLLTIFVFFGSFLAINAQVCPPTEIVVLFDHSENAVNAASTNRSSFDCDILKSSFEAFLKELTVSKAPNFRIGAFSYSSSFEQTTIVPPGSTPAEALNHVERISNGISGGSWTHKGLETITFSPAFPNSSVIVVSSQGSGSDERRRMTEKQVERVTALGWKMHVIGVQGRNMIDMEELTIVNNRKEPVILVDKSPQDPSDPKGYKKLAGEFAHFINILCLENTIITVKADPLRQ